MAILFGLSKSNAKLASALARPVAERSEGIWYVRTSYPNLCRKISRRRGISEARQKRSSSCQVIRRTPTASNPASPSRYRPETVLLKITRDSSRWWSSLVMVSARRFLGLSSQGSRSVSGLPSPARARERHSGLAIIIVGVEYGCRLTGDRTDCYSSIDADTTNQTIKGRSCKQC